jgi:hypothetical protein
MRVRIVSEDGLPQTTKVLLINDDGSQQNIVNDLKVTKIELECTPYGPWTGVLHVVVPQVDVTLDADIKEHARGKV